MQQICDTSAELSLDRPLLALPAGSRAPPNAQKPWHRALRAPREPHPAMGNLPLAPQELSGVGSPLESLEGFQQPR